MARRTMTFGVAGGEPLLSATWDNRAQEVQVGDRWIPPEILVTSRTDSEPDLMMKIEVRKGIPVWSEVTFRARPDGPEVRKRDLDIPLDDWLELIVAACSMSVGSVDSTGRATSLLRPIEDPAALTNVRRVRSGRPRIAHEHLQKVAEIYREHIEGRPTEAVSRAFGVSHRTAARHVQQARDAGLLTGTTPGKRKA
jgi:hypothetical protein